VEKIDGIHWIQMNPLDSDDQDLDLNSITSLDVIVVVVVMNYVPIIITQLTSYSSAGCSSIVVINVYFINVFFIFV